MPWSTVPSQEEDGSRRENWTVEGLSASVTLRCGWDVRHALAADMIGNRKLYISAPGPDGPFATTASIVPGDTNYLGADEAMFYQTALVTIGYDNRQPIDAFSESIEPTVEFLITKPDNMRWGTVTGPPLSDAEAPGKLFRGLNFVQTRFNVAAPLDPVYLTAVGGVNNAVYASQTLGLSFATGTLLYTPPNISRVLTTAGTGAYTITTRFTYQQQGWNKYWRADTSEWTGIVIKGDPDAVPPIPDGSYDAYPLVDFSSILA